MNCITVVSYLDITAPSGSSIRFGHRHTRTEAKRHTRNRFRQAPQGAKGVRHLFLFSVRLSHQNILVVNTIIGCCLAMMIHHRSDILLDLAAQLPQALSRPESSCTWLRTHLESGCGIPKLDDLLLTASMWVVVVGGLKMV